MAKNGITLFRIEGIRAKNIAFDSYCRDEFNGTKIFMNWSNLHEVMSFDQLHKKIGSFF